MTRTLPKIASGPASCLFDPTEAAGKDANRLTLTERVGSPAPAGGGAIPLTHQAPPAPRSGRSIDVAEFTLHRIRKDATMDPRGVTPSNPTEETKRQAEIYDYEHERPGEMLGYAIIIFFAILLAVLIGSYALPLDLSNLAIHPDCPTAAC